MEVAWVIALIGIAAPMYGIGPCAPPKEPPKFEPLPGVAVGVIGRDAARLAAREGRSGPEGAIAFVRGKGGFRWIYVPADGPDGEDVELAVGSTGQASSTFKAVKIATSKDADRLGLKEPFNLVEVEVNGGAGSPSVESFAATKIRRLGSAEGYHIKVSDTVNRTLEAAAREERERHDQVATAMKTAQLKADKTRSPSGPVEKESSVFVTWEPTTERLRVEVRRLTTNGFYVAGQGVEGPGQKPMRAGIQFGCVVSLVREYDKDGKVERESQAVFEPFVRELGMPPISSELAPSERDH